MSYVQLDDLTVGVGDEGRVIAAREILEAITRGRIASFSIQAAGTGYVVGDIVTLTPGTSTHAAQFIVIAVGGGGDVTGLEFRSAGVYTVLPDSSTTGHATTSTGAGTGLTLNVVTEASYEAVPNAAGSGYSVGDVVTVTGGTGGTTDPTFVVTAVTGGAVDELKPLDIGDRTDPPSNPASTTTGGAGTGLTVDYNQIGWVEVANDYTDDGTDFEWYARGVNVSGTDPVVALQTRLDNANPYIEISVSVDYSALESFRTQPGTWVDGYDVGSNRFVHISTTGTDPFSLFMYLSGRVVNFVLTDDNSYQLGVMGCFIPFTDDPVNTFNAPFVAGGTSCSENQDLATAWSPRGQFSNEGRTNNSGLMHPMSGLSGEPAQRAPYRCTNEIVEWQQITGDAGFAGTVKLWPWTGHWSDWANPVLAPTLNGSTSTQPDNPRNEPALQGGEGPFGGGYWGEDGTGDGSPGPAPLGASGQLHFIGPPTLIADTVSGPKLLGQLEGLASVNGTGLNDEDRIEDRQGRRWVVFPDTVTNEPRGKFAMLEG